MNDDEIGVRLRNGDPTAMEELVNLHGGRLLRSAYLLCGNETDARDLVQDTFVQAARSAYRFLGRSSTYTWLHGILRHVCSHYHRKQKRLDQTGQPVPPQTVEPPPSRLDADAASASLMQAIGRLSEEQRHVVVLRYYEGLKLEEIATYLGVSKGTVKSRLHYATRRLRELLPPELNIAGVDALP